MKLAVALLTLISAPALALEIPSAGNNPDSHMCSVPYNTNDVVKVTAAAGDNITIIFSKDERVAYVGVSDREHLKYDEIKEGGNILFFKATAEMPAQPISVRTLKQDGASRDYQLQWTATDPILHPLQPKVATAGALTAEEMPVATPCYQVRYTYASDEAAAKAAAWRVAAAKKKQDQDEIALRQQQALAARNYAYMGIGDSGLAPSEVFDDGFTTEMHFPGNTSLPIILVVDRDGKESEPAGLTTEDNGVVKLHNVYSLIRLRDGERVLCMVNRHYTQAGDNPGTGTTSPSITREVNSKR